MELTASIVLFAAMAVAWIWLPANSSASED